MSTDAPPSPDDINIPPSSHTVSVSIIRAVHTLEDPSSFYWTSSSVPTRSQVMRAPVWAFFVQHHSGRRVIFDLGLRKDAENWPPAVRADLDEESMKVIVEREVGEVLEQGGITLESIEAVIWSHAHFDHHGNIHTFPASTELIVGEGTQAHFRPGYPLKKDAGVLEGYFERREVCEVEFSGPKIHRYVSHDYFGDGSFFLLDAPGHCPGHLMALARTTVSPPTFIMLGGDAAHHVGLFRPSAFTQIPRALAESLPPPLENIAPDAPLLRVPPPGEAAAHDYTATEALVADLAVFDAREDIWVLVAHDGSITDKVPEFPETVDKWRVMDLKERVFWAFLERENSAFLW